LNGPAHGIIQSPSASMFKALNAQCLLSAPCV
jgi:hypothetical protein